MKYHNEDQFIWSEKYRPKKVKDVIIPNRLKERFQSYVDQGDVPNLILIGPSGTGKTTVALAMMNELDCDYYFVDGSLERNIDTLRNELTNFASSMSFKDRRKYIIIDEADYLNPTSTQPALRNFMQKYATSAGFIFTANYKSKIIDALYSRAATIEFVYEKKELPLLAVEFFKKIETILKNEGVEYNKKVLVSFIEKYIPDWRRMLNELQSYSKNGQIDTGILSSYSSENFSKLLLLIREKDFTNVKKWVDENIHNDVQYLFTEFYSQSGKVFDQSYIPELILTLAKYQYQSAFVVDQNINFLAFLVEVMVSAIFKS